MAIEAEQVIISKADFDQAKHNEEQLDLYQTGLNRLEDFLKEILRTNEEDFKEAIRNFNEDYDDVSIKVEGDQLNVEIS